jgi:hypothetical protein
MPEGNAATQRFDGSPASARSARVKVLDPLTSMGPSMQGELIDCSGSTLRIRVPRCILVGSSVHVRTPDIVAFADVISMREAGDGFEIEVTLK